jgi:hypothetical protein
MLITRRTLLIAIALAVSTSLPSQELEPAKKQALQQRVAELQESTAANRDKLQQYQWMETTEVDLKGQTKKTEQKLCRYGPDGKIEKTTMGSPPEPAKPRRGLKGRIVEKKVGELKDYMERLKSLVAEYVPPSREKIQDVFKAGHASMNPASGGIASLILNDYYKPGDTVTVAFDIAAKNIKSFAVNTYLDDPKNDVVTLSANFASLPDGTHYVGQTDLTSESKHIEIKTVNSDYQKLGQ